MSSHWNSLRHFVLSLALLGSSFTVLAETDVGLEAQKTACAKNAAAEWSASLNRCVSKASAKKMRHDTEDCSKLTNVEQQKTCYQKIAENKTGLNSDPNSLPEGTLGKSAIMNGAASAYAILGMINGLGGKNKNSTCTSKKIFAVTALAGTATDIWLKIQARKKLDALKNKYQIDVKNNSYDAQYKAFQYLKDEQETVKDIASKEKTRNMLLMLGYGAASVMAIYEMTPMGANADCLKKEAEKTEEQKPEAKDEVAKAGSDNPNPAANETLAASGDATKAGCNVDIDGACAYSIIDNSKGIVTTNVPAQPAEASPNVMSAKEFAGTKILKEAPLPAYQYAAPVKLHPSYQSVLPGGSK